MATRHALDEFTLDQAVFLVGFVLCKDFSKSINKETAIPDTTDLSSEFVIFVSKDSLNVKIVPEGSYCL